jgi:hypothetical protein
MDPDSGMILARTAEGAAVTLGLLHCGRVWLCPVCSAKIRHGRSEEITKAVVEWIRRGGTAYLVTFTARHAAAHRLADLMDALQGTRADASKGIKRKPGAYQRLITGGHWAGRPDRGQDGIRDHIGYVGMIRATEVTLGETNGWHPHIHAIVFVGGRTIGQGADRQVKTFRPTDEQLAMWQDHWSAVWTRHLHKVDTAFTPSDEHGVDFKELKTERDARDLGEYIAKTQDGKAPALEVARGDLKAATGGNMTPFQMLGRIGDLMGRVPEDDADGHGSLKWCLARWREYETATKGRRAIEWTRGLRQVLEIDGDDSEESDLDLMFEQDGASEFMAGVSVETEAWHQVAGRALDLAVTEAVEGGDLEQVAPLVVASGARAGAVRILTPGEVREAYEAVLAKLAERREAAAARRQVAKDQDAEHRERGTHG